MLKCNCSREEYLKDGRKEYQNYRKQVEKITRKQPLYLLENFKNRGPSNKEGTFHLDHILSVSYGFNNGITPDLIGDIRNLRFIPWKENLKKGQWMERESWDILQYFIEEEMV